MVFSSLGLEGCFLLSANTGGRLKYKMFKNAVCRNRDKGYEPQKPVVSGSRLLYSLTQLKDV
jgi:hypothetical protein